jgi:hypothetical protein
VILSQQAVACVPGGREGENVVLVTDKGRVRIRAWKRQNPYIRKGEEIIEIL